VRHQNLAEHFRSNITDFVRRFANVHAALKSVLETALAAPAGVDLCLNNNIDIAELARDLLCLIERRRYSAARCSHIEFLQQLFGLIFVDVHSQKRRLSIRRLSISVKVE
jgi:hypothetical protein